MPDSSVSSITETRPWPRNEIPHQVEYSPEVFERLRLAALDGFLALPRTGIGIGGFLLGSYAAGRSRILDFLPVACSHADGPSFRLSGPEVAAAKALSGSVPPSSVLGFYLSKTRGKAGLSDEDTALLAQLCPEPGHFALVLRSSMSEPSRASLFLKVKGGAFKSAGEMDLVPVEAEGHLQDAVSPPPPASMVARSAPTPPVAQAPKPPAEKPKLRPAPVAALDEPQYVAPLPLPRTFQAPAFLTPAPRPSWQKPALAGLLFLCIAGGAAWVTQDTWLPRPPLTLSATDADHHVTFKWNPESVRGMKGVTLVVNDGGENKNFALTAPMLERGHFVYDRASGRVTGVLNAGEARVLATFLEPVAAPKPSQ